MKLNDLLPVSSELSIKWPDGEATGITMTVISADSKQFHATVSRQAQAALGKEDEQSIAERQQRLSEQVAACIIGWTGFDDATFSPEKAIEVMANPELAFIREQVEAHVTKRANFFRRSPTAAVPAHPAVGAPKHAKQNGVNPPPSARGQPTPSQESEPQHATN